MQYNAQYDRYYTQTLDPDPATGLVHMTVATWFVRDGNRVRECLLRGVGFDFNIGEARRELLGLLRDCEHYYLTCFLQDLLQNSLCADPTDAKYPVPVWDTGRTDKQLHTDRYRWAHSAWKGAWKGYDRLPQSRHGLWPRKRADRVRAALLDLGADATKLVVAVVNDYDTEVVYDGKVVHRPTPTNARRFFEELFGHKLGAT